MSKEDTATTPPPLQRNPPLPGRPESTPSSSDHQQCTLTCAARDCEFNLLGSWTASCALNIVAIAADGTCASRVVGKRTGGNT